jgi:amino acid transporter
MFIGFLLIILGVTSSQILAISALAFNICFGLCMYSFIKARKDPRFKDVPRKYLAPKWAVPGAYFMMIFEFFFMTPGILYYVYVNMGMWYVILGIAVNLLYIPCWIVLQWWNTQTHPDVVTGVQFAKESNPLPKLIGVFAIVCATVAFMTVVGGWIVTDAGEIDPFAMLSGSNGFMDLVPILTFVIALAIAIIEVANFLSKKASVPLTALSAALSVIGLVMLIMFCFFNPTMELTQAPIIALGAMGASTVITACQLIGTTAKSEGIFNKTYA